MIDSCTIHVSSNDTSLGYVVQESGVCGEHGSCVSSSNNAYKCQCKSGYEGEFCERSKWRVVALMRAVLGFSLLFLLVHYYLRTYMPTLAEIEMLMEGARKVIVTLDIGRRGSLPPFERDIASVCWNNYRVFYAKKKDPETRKVC